MEDGKGHERNSYLKDHQIETYLIIPGDIYRLVSLLYATKKKRIHETDSVICVTNWNEFVLFVIIFLYNSKFVHIIRAIKQNKQNKRANHSSINGNVSKELRMMGHTPKSQKNAARLGFSDSNDAKDPEDEVNDYLMRAIDARSIDRLRSEHCTSVLLSFKKTDIEKKVSVFGRFLPIIRVFVLVFINLYGFISILFRLVYFGAGSYAGQIFML